MLQLQYTLEEQKVIIPRPKVLPPSGAWALTLTDGVTRKTMTFDGAPVINGMVMELTLKFTERPDKGQYSYTLTRDDEVVSYGLAQIGQTRMKPKRIVYDKQIETIQYNG